MKSHLRIIITVSFLFISQLSFAQILNSDFNKKLRYTRAVNIARSTFDVTGFPSSPVYPSLELRLGAGILKPLAKHLDLKSGIYLGLKLKRQSYYFGLSKQYTTEPWVLPALDEAASSRNHFFVDIPLVLQFNPPKTRIGLKGGLNFRFWAPNNDSVDVLTARPEIGLIGGISYNLIKNISIGLEHYYGLTDILGGSYTGTNNQLTRYHVRNQFTQITIEQTF